MHPKVSHLSISCCQEQEGSSKLIPHPRTPILIS